MGCRQEFRDQASLDAFVTARQAEMTTESDAASTLGATMLADISALLTNLNALLAHQAAYDQASSEAFTGRVTTAQATPSRRSSERGSRTGYQSCSDSPPTGRRLPDDHRYHAPPVLAMSDFSVPKLLTGVGMGVAGLIPPFDPNLVIVGGLTALDGTGLLGGHIAAEQPGQTLNAVSSHTAVPVRYGARWVGGVLGR